MRRSPDLVTFFSDCYVYLKEHTCDTRCNWCKGTGNTIKIYIRCWWLMTSQLAKHILMTLPFITNILWETSHPLRNQYDTRRSIWNHTKAHLWVLTEVIIKSEQRFTEIECWRTPQIISYPSFSKGKSNTTGRDIYLIPSWKPEKKGDATKNVARWKPIWNQFPNFLNFFRSWFSWF